MTTTSPSPPRKKAAVMWPRRSTVPTTAPKSGPFAASGMTGWAFIRTYYAVSPALVRRFGETAWFKALWRGPLDRLVRKLRTQGVEDTPYQDKDW